MFNEVQKALLLAARRTIEERGSRFICCSITLAVEEIRLKDVPYEEHFQEGRRLKEQIEFGIDGYSSMETWLFSEVGIYPQDITIETGDAWNKYAFAGWKTPMSRYEFENLCRVARLTWIDRAIETGSLV
jgi:hypothetical protein